MERNKALRTCLLGAVFLLGPFIGVSFGQDPAIGDWGGKLLTPGGELRIRFHIEKKGDGLGGTMDSPDQNVSGVVLDTIEREGDSLWIRIPSLQAHYKGVFLNPDSLDGQWVQLGKSYPLDLARGVEMSPGSRPQTPSPPYPYRSIDTSFQQRPVGFRLAGTVTLPKGEGPFPGVVLVSGSGPQDRNETMARHEPFHVIADHLTRKGFAVLRYDDRGVAGSEGSFQGSGIEDFVKDARSAYGFLKGFEEVDPDRVGYLGHSEGGLVVSRIVSSGADPEFLVLLASPSLPGDRTLMVQNRLMLSKAEVGPKLRKARLMVLDSLTRYIGKKRDTSFIDRRLRHLVPRAFGGLVDSTRQKRFLKNYMHYAHSGWFHSFIRYDPRKAYRKLDVPVLALFGQNDLQVPPDPHAKKMRKLFSDKERAEVKVIKGVNHLFQPDSVGLPTRYGKIETTIDPSVLKRISRWLKEKE